MAHTEEQAPIGFPEVADSKGLKTGALGPCRVWWSAWRRLPRPIASRRAWVSPSPPPMGTASWASSAVDHVAGVRPDVP